jgi:hypothetical protein
LDIRISAADADNVRAVLSVAHYHGDLHEFHALERVQLASMDGLYQLHAPVSTEKLRRLAA